MDKNAIKFARYWRASVADSKIGCGAVDESETRQYHTVKNTSWLTGKLPHDVVEKLFNNQPPETRMVSISYRPFLMGRRKEHSVGRSGTPYWMTPLLITALVDDAGRIFPEACTIPRDLLEPQDHVAFTIGLLDDMDEYLSREPIQGFGYPEDHANDTELVEIFQSKRWKDFSNACTLMIEEVAPTSIRDSEHYVRLEMSLVQERETGPDNTTKEIIDLYDQLLLSGVNTPLFDTFASTRPSPIEDCIPSVDLMSVRVAHPNDRNPLNIAQRDALGHALRCEIGEIIPVNGPPGTGKTTLVLSIVASLWTRAAMQGSEPPVIVAASNNNQAVTNIIDAFGKDFAEGRGPLAGRWLPNVNSYGSYLPAMSREEEAAKKYITQSFFNEVETDDYLERATEQYLNAASKAFPGADISHVEDAIELLQREMHALYNTIGDVKKAWAEYVESMATHESILGNNPEEKIRTASALAQEAEGEVTQYNQAIRAWRKYLENESPWLAFFSFIPPVAASRLQKAKWFVQSKWPGSGAYISRSTDLEHLNDQLYTSIKHLEQKNVEAQQQLSRLQSASRARATAEENWQFTLEQMGINDNPQATLQDIDRNIDCSIRFTLFRLAVHYWEGRWLSEVNALGRDKAEEKKRRGKAAMEARWRRRMMLTPCSVMTFASLPKHLSFRKLNGAKTFDTDYLYNFADYLIVDEAGQVSPEIAGASFSLAKSAIIVGDTFQLDPIWNVPAPIDVGNLMRQGLIDPANIEDSYNEMVLSGKTAAGGNVMRVAQFASRYHYDRDLARGMYLFEHRRCLDPIIAFCNELCYGGKLIAKRGPGGDAPFPALAYLNIVGTGQSHNDGSRSNKDEAAAVAEWIADNREALEAYYKKPIGEIVGVVTPFRGQATMIARACRSRQLPIGGAHDALTIGTVHALQGAERPVILFSPVYTEASMGTFIDSSHSMLNVTVSRTKDSFVVVGDMNIFRNASRSSHRGLLGRHVLRIKNGELQLKRAAEVIDDVYHGHDQEQV